MGQTTAEYFTPHAQIPPVSEYDRLNLLEPIDLIRTIDLHEPAIEDMTWQELLTLQPIIQVLARKHQASEIADPSLAERAARTITAFQENIMAQRIVECDDCTVDTEMAMLSTKPAVHAVIRESNEDFRSTLAKAVKGKRSSLQKPIR